MELKPLGIKVSMVEPGDVHTGFTSGRQTAVAAAKGSVYGDRFTKAVNSMVKSELGGPGPEVVAKVVVRAVERKHPPVRAVVGISYKTLVFLKRFLPANFI
jgi:short-subunit dehydrogenase